MAGLGIFLETDSESQLLSMTPSDLDFLMSNTLEANQGILEIAPGLSIEPISEACTRPSCDGCNGCSKSLTVELSSQNNEPMTVEIDVPAAGLDNELHTAQQTSVTDKIEDTFVLEDPSDSIIMMQMDQTTQASQISVHTNELSVSSLITLTDNRSPIILVIDASQIEKNSSKTAIPESAVRMEQEVADRAKETRANEIKISNELVEQRRLLVATEKERMSVVDTERKVREKIALAVAEKDALKERPQDTSVISEKRNLNSVVRELSVQPTVERPLKADTDPVKPQEIKEIKPEVEVREAREVEPELDAAIEGKIEDRRQEAAEIRNEADIILGTAVNEEREIEIIIPSMVVERVVVEEQIIEKSVTVELVEERDPEVTPLEAMVEVQEFLEVPEDIQSLDAAIMEEVEENAAIDMEEESVVAVEVASVEQIAEMDSLDTQAQTNLNENDPEIEIELEMSVQSVDLEVTAEVHEEVAEPIELAVSEEELVDGVREQFEVDIVLAEDREVGPNSSEVFLSPIED
ncbi:MAG: hypothetical protein SGJ02_01410, partial [bacterium]|nr:hypothetical protein [bacterium]